MSSVLERDPEYFSRCAEIQKPSFLWLGCSDSRVVAEAATGLSAGDVFVHRNVGNVLNHSDTNAMSALEYSVKVRSGLAVMLRSITHSFPNHDQRGRLSSRLAVHFAPCACQPHDSH